MRTVITTLRADRVRLSWARAVVRTQLLGCPAEMVLAAQIVVTELLTNAHTHTRRPLELRLFTTAQRLKWRVEVDDDDLRPIRVPGPEATGRGLVLVDHFATRWGALAGERGKTVWAEVLGRGTWVVPPNC